MEVSDTTLFTIWRMLQMSKW